MLAACLVAAAAAIPAIEIVSPPAGQPAFGRVAVIVQSDQPEEIVSVELFVDGARTASRERPPFRFTVDLGDDNVEHGFRAVARCRSGALVEAELRTPAIQIDAQLGFELQQLYVTAREQGRAVLDLQRADFEVRDNGERQELASFERGHLPFTACILLDASASMAGDKLRAAVAGARAFAAGMRPLDESKLLVFSDRLLFQSEFVDAEKGFGEALDGLVAGGGTALNDVLFLALRQLEARQGRRVVIVLSDGSDSLSVLEIGDVLRQARRTRAIVYWFRVAGPAGERPDLNRSAWRTSAGFVEQARSLERIVEESGGTTRTVETPGAMRDAFADVLGELREQYMLGYYPGNARNDGSWHRVDVDVRRSGVRLRTSAGYVDY